MSATILYAVNEEGTVQPHSQFKNSWGSAMLVWDYLAQKYHPAPPNHDPTDMWSFCTINPNFIKKVWDLQNKEDLPLCEYAALLTTFDGAMCRREYLPRLSALLLEFDTLAREKWPDRTVNSIGEQARALMNVYNSEYGWQAVCWQQTTCGPEQWHDKGGIEGPYNIQGDAHWFLDDELKEREAKLVA
jgi:hypothetical protein